MAKIEEGKYYVDGEGFYKCIGKKEFQNKKNVLVDAVIIRYNSVSYYARLTYVEEACERRMVECSEEDYNFVLKQAVSICNRLDNYNTAVFKHLWMNKEE